MVINVLVRLDENLSNLLSSANVSSQSSAFGYLKVHIRQLIKTYYRANYIANCVGLPETTGCTMPH